MSRVSRQFLPLSVALILLLVLWQYRRSTGPAVSVEREEVPPPRLEPQFHSFNPQDYLNRAIEPSSNCLKVLATPLSKLRRGEVTQLSEEERAYLIREYLADPDPARRRRLVDILKNTFSLEAARLFKYSLEQEYLMRSTPLSPEERRFPEALVSGIGMVAMREDAALAYLKHLANPWNVLVLMSPDYPQPNPPIDLPGLISSSAIFSIGATGREDAYAMLLELRQGALVDPTHAEGKGRHFSTMFLTAARAWDGFHGHRAAYPNWETEGVISHPGTSDDEVIRQARLRWEQSPRGREWMEWYYSLPADQQNPSLPGR